MWDTLPWLRAGRGCGGLEVTASVDGAEPFRVAGTKAEGENSRPGRWVARRTFSDQSRRPKKGEEPALADSPPSRSTGETGLVPWRIPSPPGTPDASRHGEPISTMPCLSPDRNSGSGDEAALRRWK